MGGTYIDQDLKAGGLDAKKETRFARLPVGQVLFAPADHALAHDREHDPIRPAMVADIRAKGVQKPLLVWFAGRKNGVDRYYVIDGAQRKIHATAAEAEMVAAGELPARKSDPPWLWVPIEIFEGSPAEALLERMRRNTDPLKKADCPSVLHATVARLLRLSVDPAEIVPVLPAGSTLDSIKRWPSVHAEVRVLLDAHLSPWGLLAAIVTIEHDEQPHALGAMIAAGATTAKKARKAAQERTGNATPPVPRLPSPPTFAAMRAVVGPLRTAPVRDLLDALAGEWGALEKSAPDLAAAMQAARAKASKPGRKS